MDLENQQTLLPQHASSLSRFSRLTSSVLNINFDHDDDRGGGGDDGDGEGDDRDHGHGHPFQVGPPECPYPRPFLILDLIWNLGFVLVAGVVLLTTITERPSTPLRIWIGGYALQCLLHVAFVWIEHHRHFDGFHRPFSLLFHHTFIKKLESINTVISSVWWVFGFYWIYMGGQTLLQDSPRLYWLSVVFLAFDVFFMIFCIAMACMVFVLLVCCFPVLARVAYAMTIGDGASEDDIRLLPKYRYCQPKTSGTFSDCKKQEEAGLVAHSGSNNNIPELALSIEDSECCICLHSYENGVELCTLPCNHHFHYRCIRKWLRINATCPLCKFNILPR